jgi:hypothetical protein
MTAKDEARQVRTGWRKEEGAKAKAEETVIVDASTVETLFSTAARL